MKKSILLATFISLSTLSFSAFAQDSENPAESFAMFCGSRAELTQLAKAQGQKITKADLAELNQSRRPILNILVNGNEAIQQLLDEGSKANTGAFGVVMACGMIDQLKNEISQKGCVDLETNKAVMNVSGIQACEAVMKKLNK